MWCEAPLLELEVTQSVVQKYLEIAEGGEGSHNQMFTCFQKIKLQSVILPIRNFLEGLNSTFFKIYLLCQLGDLFLICLVGLVGLGGNKSWCSCHWLEIIFSLNLGIWQYNSLGSHFLPFLLSSSKENK